MTTGAQVTWRGMSNDRIQSCDHDYGNALLRRGLYLEYATLAWNVVGTAVVLTAAMNARSVSLIGFGLDSLIEIGASSVVVWELKGVGSPRRRRALRIIGAGFISLSAYMLIQSIRAIYLRSHPNGSPLGIAWLALTFIAMVLLAVAKARTGKKLGNPVLLAESRVTMVDAYLAASVLTGLILNSTFGWWWADALAGFVIVVYGVIEGRHAWAEGASAADPIV